MRQILDDVFLFEDSCNVYVIRSGSQAVLVDFGTGSVLDHLAEIGVDQVTDVLLTHHHRDQAQGLPRAAHSGARIWVPHTEQDLFARVDHHWRARELDNNYNNRQDRFSLLEPVHIDGTLLDYETRRFGAYDFLVVPTPGHTTGSVTLLAEINATQVAFTGDLIYAPGKVWSMAATQWSYNGAEGVAAGIASLLDLKDRQPELLLPSHGGPMDDPAPAIDLLVQRFWELLQLRGQNPNLFRLRDNPYQPVTPHLLWHRASMANTYVLLSESKKALLFDFGYDFITGIPAGSDRASRRPWLYTLPTLKRQYNVETIDVILPTHFHDDHVAGINLLRRVEGAQVWAADLFADILERPKHYDLPCLWYDHIPVDRTLPLETAIQWEEYTLTLYPLPGHTRYAVAIALEVDGRRVLVAGDQYQGDAGLELNYVYANRFHAADYVRSADLYRRLNPEIIVTGHWEPFHVPAGYFDQLGEMGASLQRLHTDLLPSTPDMGDEGFLARLSPYQITAQPGATFTVHAEIRNPHGQPTEAVAQIVVPDGWQVTSAEWQGQPLTVDAGRVTFMLAAPNLSVLTFHITPVASSPVYRSRIALDLTIGDQRFGQQAEALVTIT